MTALNAHGGNLLNAVTRSAYFPIASAAKPFFDSGGRSC